MKFNPKRLAFSLSVALLLSACGSRAVPSSEASRSASSTDPEISSVSSDKQSYVSLPNLRISNFRKGRAVGVSKRAGESFSLVLEQDDGTYIPAEYALADKGNTLDHDLYLSSCVQFDDYSLLTYTGSLPAGHANSSIIRPALGEVYGISDTFSGRWSDHFPFLLNHKTGYLYSIVDLVQKMAHHESNNPETVVYQIALQQSLIDPNVFFAAAKNDYYPYGSETPVYSVPAGPAAMDFLRQIDYITKITIGETLEFANYVSTKIANFPVYEDMEGNVMFGKLSSGSSVLEGIVYDTSGRGIQIPPTEYGEPSFLDYDFFNNRFAYKGGYLVDGKLDGTEYGKSQDLDSYKRYTYLMSDGESKYYRSENEIYKIRPVESAPGGYEITKLFSGQYEVGVCLVDLKLPEGKVSTYNLATHVIRTLDIDAEALKTSRVVSTKIEDGNLIIDAFSGFKETIYYLDPLTGKTSNQHIDMDITVYYVSPTNGDNYFDDIGWQNRIFYDMSGIRFENKVYAYDGEEHALVISGELPEGVSVSYSANKLTEVGSIEVTASFRSSAKYYEPIPDMKATLTITEA